MLLYFIIARDCIGCAKKTFECFAFSMRLIFAKVLPCLRAIRIVEKVFFIAVKWNERQRFLAKTLKHWLIKHKQFTVQVIHTVTPIVLKVLSEFPCFRLTTDSFCFILLPMKWYMILFLKCDDPSFIRIHCTISNNWRFINGAVDSLPNDASVFEYVHKIYKYNTILKLLKCFNVSSPRSNLNNEKQWKTMTMTPSRHTSKLKMNKYALSQNKINKMESTIINVTYLLKPFCLSNSSAAFNTPSHRERMHFVSHKILSILI